ncbi:hypothetical protein [Caballeronia sordidicola]|uniref:Uncharacterized protein n=1 Tax=Caballeronia sordidicola TaxID=196367 RepID=A0A226WYI0_CABSO|nr:hypothetical protein [Caballeronia sordidicola]OXC75668.1 hypothetical protein BSU04_25905 [Caballeronia sordidicola]
MNQPKLNVAAMQWSALDHIADVKPIGDADAACLEEIRQVLLKHGQTARFGVSLLHSHFDLAPEEMMLEETNVETREQWVRPVSRQYLTDNGIVAQTTVVSFDERGMNQLCGCNPRSSGHFHL